MNLPPGTCRVAIERAGFKAFVKYGVSLSAGDRVAIEPEHEIGAGERTRYCFHDGGKHRDRIAPCWLNGIELRS